MALRSVTVSKPRYGKFESMPIADEMVARNLDPICAVLVIDLARGEIVEWLRLEGDVQELFTVELMPGIRCPMVVGPSTEEFAETITFDAEVVSRIVLTGRWRVVRPTLSSPLSHVALMLQRLADLLRTTVFTFFSTLVS